MRKSRNELKRKSFGQNFLVHEPTIEKIMQFVLNRYEALNRPPVLEIGPGRGALTNKFLEHEALAQNLTLIEKDREIASKWQELEKHSDFKVIESDVLKVKEEDWAKDLPCLVVSNLPYSSSIAIMNLLTSQRSSISEMILMFQKEVADRIHLSLGSRSTGSLTIWTQNFWEVKPVLIVPPNAFKPAPKVQSTVVHFKKRSAPLIPHTNEIPKEFQKLLEICFKQPRRMIRSNLKLLPHGEDMLDHTTINPSFRPQHLSWKHWKELFEAHIQLNTKVVLP